MVSIVAIIKHVIKKLSLQTVAGCPQALSILYSRQESVNYISRVESEW